MAKKDTTTIGVEGFTADAKVRRTARGVLVEVGPIGPGKLVFSAEVDLATAEDLGSRLVDAARRDPPSAAKAAAPRTGVDPARGARNSSPAMRGGSKRPKKGGG